MGLAVSQVRLLALTTRKADIELQMQVDSKRKQMLTRKSTELAQQYYARLQDANVQYATSNGYEDVTYNYLMGQSSNGFITDDFWTQMSTGSDQNIAQKTDNRMILTDQYGQVILNNELAIAVEKAKDAYSQSSIATQSCQAIWTLLEQNQNNSTVSSVFNKLRAIGQADSIKYMELMLKNGGYQNGGTVYTDGTNYYSSIDVARNSSTASEDDRVALQAGYCYQVLDCNASTVVSGNFYDGTSFTDLTRQMAQYLGNIISYLGPMISAAIQNGSSATADIQGNKTEVAGYVIDEAAGTWRTADGRRNGTIGDGTVLYEYSLTDNQNTGYTNALNGDKLQAGFKSGTYQLCMVSDAAKGIYHKNTTLEYFVHMNYVVQKTDSSQREEITAWFNAEQADISEQETYWDTEITNLSTELNSVNTEIESVKTLKSNAIKSVFDWGSS